MAGNTISNSEARQHPTDFLIPSEERVVAPYLEPETPEEERNHELHMSPEQAQEMTEVMMEAARAIAFEQAQHTVEVTPGVSPELMAELQMTMAEAPARGIAAEPEVAAAPRYAELLLPPSELYEGVRVKGEYLMVYRRNLQLLHEAQGK